MLIVEKQAEDARRPNSRFSGGLFIAPNDVDGATAYMKGLYRINDELYETDPAVIRAWAEVTSTNHTWLEKQGAKVVKIFDHGEHAAVDGYQSISIYKPDMIDHPRTGHRGWGYGLFAFLQEQVTQRAIEIMYDTPAEWLLTNAAGDVIGVRVRRQGREVNIACSRGVIMTCGGFEFSDWLKSNYLKVFPTHFYGNPENTGDGLAMAQDVGADLWHMNSCAARLVARFPESGYPGGCPIDLWGVEGVEGLKALMPHFEAFDETESGQQAALRSRTTVPLAQIEVPAPDAMPGAIVTDRYGRRFTSELYRTHTLYYELTNLDTHKLVYPKIPSWWIFDERRVQAGPLTPIYMGPTGPLQQIPWSADNRAEIEKGWIISASSIPELAQKCGMDAEVLTGTVEQLQQVLPARRGP